MKQKFFLFLTLAVITGSCKKDDKTEDPVPAQGNVTVYFSNEVDGQLIQLGQRIYQNAADEMYQVDALKYYVSHVRFVKSDGSEFDLGNYDLINHAIDTTCRVYGKNIPNGTYNRLRFTIGVDSVRNHTGAQTGDLETSLGMFWAWNTGYVFFKHDGYFDGTATSTPLQYHFGTDRALSFIDIPISLVVNGDNKKLFLDFNLNKLYSTPNIITFDGNNSHQSTSNNDTIWIDQLKANFPNSFIYDRTE